MSDASAIYLSRLVFNPRARDVQRGIENCHLLHQTIMRGFPTVASDAPRKELAVLYRPELDPRSGAFITLVQSAVEPDWSHLHNGRQPAVAVIQAEPAVKRVDPALRRIAAGDRLRFRLRANPTKRLAVLDPSGGLAKRPDGRTKLGPRVSIIREDAQLAWLARKAETAGFRVDAAQARPDRFGGDRQTGRKREGATITLDAVVFDGELTVTDAGLFRQALVNGIGSGKAFGFGLLSVAPAS